MLEVGAGKGEFREMRAYVDENATMHGSFIEGTPVVGLEGIARWGIRHLALAVSPIYRKQAARKLFQFNVVQYVG